MLQQQLLHYNFGSVPTNKMWVALLEHNNSALDNLFEWSATKACEIWQKWSDQEQMDGMFQWTTT